MHTQTQQNQEISAPSPSPPGAARPIAPKASSPEADDMIIDIGASFWDMTESETQALDLNASDLSRVKDSESSWPVDDRSPRPSPMLWFVTRNYREGPKGCLPEDPFSVEGEYLVSPYTSPGASPPPDLPIRSAPMTNAYAKPLVTASPSCSPKLRADADVPPASPMYIEKAKVRLDYIVNALCVEKSYEICHSTGEREFWDSSRLAMTEKIQGDRDWRDWMEDGTCGYTYRRGFS